MTAILKTVKSLYVQNRLPDLKKQEAQLSPRDHAIRRVS